MEELICAVCGRSAVSFCHFRQKYARPKYFCLSHSYGNVVDFLPGFNWGNA